MAKKSKKNAVDGPVAAKMRTICEVHRDIYDIVITINDEKKKKELVELLVEVYDMGKRMALKLLEYKGGDKKAFWKEMEYKHNLDYKLKKWKRKKRNQV